MFGRFFDDQSGAVTADWVVLTGAVVELGIASLAMVSGGLKDLSSDTSAQLSGQSLRTTFGGAFASQTVGSFDFADGTLTGWIGG